MTIKQVTDNKKQFIDLLLLGDEQESMIDRYLEQGDLFALYDHVSDLKYWDSEIPALYAVRGIPANVLLNPDGIIIARNVMGEQLEQALQKELNK